MYSLYSKEKNVTGEDTTVLNVTSVLKGNISANGKLEIRGTVAGKIKMENGDLIIREGASVEGDIEAENIFIEGTVRGNIKAYARLALANNSRVLGDLTTLILEIKAGALYHGSVSMADKS